MPVSVGIDDIIGAALGLDSGLGAGEDALAQLLSGDVTEQLAELGLGIDDIVGAVLKKSAHKAMPAGNTAAALQNLALLKAAGQRGVTSKQADNLKYELLPIPLTQLVAGAGGAIAVRPIRSMRMDRMEFPSSNVDHQFIQLNSVQILGIEQLNGTGGILLSQLSEQRTEPILRGTTAQAGQDIILQFANLDTVNARSYRGTFAGPSIRA